MQGVRELRIREEGRIQQTASLLRIWRISAGDHGAMARHPPSPKASAKAGVGGAGKTVNSRVPGSGACCRRTEKRRTTSRRSDTPICSSCPLGSRSNRTSSIGEELLLSEADLKARCQHETCQFSSTDNG